MEQGVKYVVSLEDAGVSSTLHGWERDAMSFEKSVSTLNTTLQGFGLYLGGRELFNFGKDIVETTTKLESYKNLIKFASDNTFEATQNQLAINKAVTDFKLPIMETYQEYAQLMAMVKGTPAEGEKARAMFQDLSETLTILHLPAEKVQQAIAGIGKLLEEGNLQPRYLRPLIANLPGFGVNLANEMGLSMQGLNEKIRKGALTTTNSYEYIPKVLKDMKDMYDQHLPEALRSYQAETNDLHNAWLSFQADLGDKLKPEIIALFHEIKSGVEWMKEHEEQLISWGKTIVHIGEAYLAFKAIQLSFNIVQGATNLLWGIGIEKEVTQIGVTNTLTASVIELTAALEALNVAQTTAAEGIALYDEMGGAVTAMTGAFGLTEAVVGSGARGAMLGTTEAAAVMVNLVGVSAAILGAFALAFGDRDDGRTWHYDKRLSPEANAKDKKAYDESKGINTSLFDRFFQSDHSWKASASNEHKADTTGFNAYQAQYMRMNGGGGYFPMPNFPDYLSTVNDKEKHDKEKHNKGTGNISPLTDKVTGQRVINYNITIQKMIGIDTLETKTFKEGSAAAGEQILRHMTNAINDSQIGATHE